jgi:hypothetical protein
VSFLAGTLAVAAVAALAAWLVLGAVGRTVRRHERDVPALPDCPPAAEAELAAPRARYLGTTLAPSTLRRFAGHGLLGRDVVGLALERAGLRVLRPARPCWWIPAEALRGAEVASHHAGKAVGAPRVLVVDWVLGTCGLRSGFVLEQPAAAAWAAALRRRVAG